MNDDGTTECPGQVPGEDDKSIGDAIQGFIHNDINKPNGIIILEHELTSYSVGHFKNMYPQLKGIGWTPKSIPELVGRDWYANAVNGTSPITSQNNMILTAAITPQNVSNVAKKVNSSSMVSLPSSSASAASSSKASTSTSASPSADSKHGHSSAALGLSLPPGLLLVLLASLSTILFL